MELTLEDVKKIALLARLKLTDSEVSHYQKELLKILNAFQNLSNYATSNNLDNKQQSLCQIDETTADAKKLSRMRADIVENILSTKEFLSETPDKEGSFVRVPAILERST